MIEVHTISSKQHRPASSAPCTRPFFFFYRVFVFSRPLIVVVVVLFFCVCLCCYINKPPCAQSAEAAQLRRGEPVAAASGRPGGDGEHTARVRAAEPLLHVPRRCFGFPGVATHFGLPGVETQNQKPNRYVGNMQVCMKNIKISTNWCCCGASSKRLW